MKSLIVYLSIILLLSFQSIAFAYEVPTHRELSKVAVDRSGLKVDSTILSNLGLKPPDDPTQKFPNSQETERTIKELIEDGSAFEDNGFRALNHFYNPLTGRAISSAGSPSPDWALEDHGEIGGQNDSFFDARKFLLGALSEQNETVRKTLFGRTFQSLGQVIHHLQDMAQPQHVRHDQHLNFIPWFDLIPPENPSWYEEYAGKKNICETLDQLCSGFMPPVRFEKAREFWATADGRGLAQFTNSNFVTEGTNFRGSLEHIEPHEGLPTPNGENVAIEMKEVGDPELGHLALQVDGAYLTQETRPLNGKLFFIGTPVVDNYLGGTYENPRTSTFSLYDEDLHNYRLRICGTAGSPCAEAEPTFTLNHFNFDAAHRFLIPKAISYSAGLIDYFFRGKVEMCDGETSDQSIIKNLSLTEDMKGVFALYYDDETGMRHQIAEWRTTDPGMLPEDANGVLAKNGGEMRVTFPPPDPKPDTYFLVFYGDMGEEQAPRDAKGNILPGGAVVVTKVDTTKHCKGILWAINAHPSQIGTMTAYHLPDGRPLETVPLPPDTVGIAYDPRDGNLWYTVLTSPPSTNLGKIFKMAPDGTLLPEEITVQGTERRSDGSVQTDLAALDVDPDDPAYLWVTGAFSPTNTNHYLVYRVRISDGQVVHRCHVFIPEGPSVGGYNGVLAVTKQGEGTVFLVAPNFGGYRQPLQAFEAYTCSRLFSAELFPDNSSQHFGALIWSIEASRDNLIVSALKTDRTSGIYLGAPPYTPEGILLPGTSIGRDLAVGSSF